MFFEHKIFLLDINLERREEVLRYVANKLERSGVVTEEFGQAIIDRENRFPTGLCINGTGIAIPHTDADKVNESQIAIAKLNNRISFIEMGSKDKEVEVDYIFMLALNGSKEQLNVLQKLVNLFQQDVFIKVLSECKSEGDIENLIIDFKLNEE